MPESGALALGSLKCFIGRCALTLPGCFVIQLVWLLTPGVLGRRIPVWPGRFRSEKLKMIEHLGGVCPDEIQPHAREHIR